VSAASLRQIAATGGDARGAIEKRRKVILKKHF
jgi:hypothetical protein